MAPPRQIRQGLSDVAVIAGAAAGREITTHGFLGSFPTVAHHLVDRALVVMDGLHHAFKDGSRTFRASSGSRSASSSIDPLRSANSTVTCLRSPRGHS